MKVLVAGAGVGGLTTAVALRARGIDVEVFESAPGPSTSGGGLGIAGNATRVLSALGLDLPEDGVGRVCERLFLRTARGRPMREIPFGPIAEELGSPVVNVRRSDLLARLRDALADTPVHYGAEVTRCDRVGAGVAITCADGVTHTGEVLVGADGIRSAVRELSTAREPVREYGYVCWIATVPFEHPRLPTGGAAHYWGTGQRFGLIDIGDGRAYWWGTKNTPSRRPLRWAGTKDRILDSYEGWADEVRQAISLTEDEAVISVPAQDRPFLETWGIGPVTLVGDAAHPMLTSLSQGAGTAIEDGHALAHHLAAGPEPVTALRRYERARRDRTRWLVSAARRLSRLEQLGHPLTAGLRNLVLRHAPSSVVHRQIVAPMRYDPPA
ncbi:FAD-dependent monooxygenase [Streptomyces sp. NPDC054786]